MMKILLSAYACEPNKGSEPGVGWHWCMELVKLGHEIWVITRANNRNNIEQALSALPEMSNLHFVYYDLPKWAGWWKQGSRRGFVNLYYALWQWGAYRAAKKICRQQLFDVVHHLTFGVFRQPSFMGRLGIPFIVGPVGGGERAPFQLRKNYIFRDYLLDFCRDLLNALSRFDPLLNDMFKKAFLIYVKTPETGRMISPHYQHKVRSLLEIGVNLPSQSRKQSSCISFSPEHPIKILYVGHFLSLKGMQIGIPAFARLTRDIPYAQLTMIGKGPAEEAWKSLGEKLGIESKIQWRGWVTQQVLAEIYADHDVLLFPSLHDSSGNVVLEAMSHGLPVLCLNLGGPAVIVNHDCGMVVPVEGGVDYVIERLYQAMRNLAMLPPEEMGILRNGAYQRAQYFSWSRPVKIVYESDIQRENIIRS